MPLTQTQTLSFRLWDEFEFELALELEGREFPSHTQDKGRYSTSMYADPAADRAYSSASGRVPCS